MASDFHFDCVFYYVLDLERAIRFYTEVLGLRLVSRDVVARFDVDGVALELVPTADQSLVGGHGNARLTLSVNDIHAEVAALRDKGVHVTEVHAVENGDLASLADPDGNKIALWQSVQGQARANVQAG
jgi:catechol 2,3-dioxygenase-like lactoylglutathione lyase family enzyme